MGFSSNTRVGSAAAPILEAVVIKKNLRARRGSKAGESMNILCTVDVPTNAGRPHDLRFDAMLSGDAQMRIKAVITKCKRYGVRRRNHNGVGAEIVVGGDDGERRRRPVKLQKPADLILGDEGYVAGYLQHAAAPFTGETLCRRRDDGGMATTRLVGNDARAIASGDPGRRMVGGRHHDPGQTPCRRQGVQHVFKHRKRETRPQMCGYEVGQPLLRRGGFLDGQDGPDAGPRHQQGRPPTRGSYSTRGEATTDRFKISGGFTDYPNAARNRGITVSP